VNEGSRSEFLSRVLIAVGVVAFAVVSLLLLWAAAEVVWLSFAGLLLAVFLRALSKPLTKYLRLPDALAVVSVVLFLAGALGVAGWFYAPILAEQAGEFIESIPAAIEEIEASLRDARLGQTLLEQLPDLEELSPSAEMMAQAFAAVFTTVEALLYVVFVLFAGMFLAFQPELYRNGLAALVPQNKRARAREAIDVSIKTLRGWLLGRLVSMLSVGVMVTVGLWLLDIPLAFFLGFLAFLLDFIPYIGPFIAAIPAVILAFAQSPMDAVWVALLYFVVQNIESYLVTPVVQQQAVHLPPVLTLIIVLVMGLLFGLLGVIVGTPLAAVLLVLTKMLYVEDVLNDKVEIKARDG
jgi:predicted PurR-regulated permease PerM